MTVSNLVERDRRRPTSFITAWTNDAIFRKSLPRFAVLKVRVASLATRRSGEIIHHERSAVSVGLKRSLGNRVAFSGIEDCANRAIAEGSA